MRVQDAVTALKGVGPKKTTYLKKLRIHTVADLLFHFPFRYENRSRETEFHEFENQSAVYSSGTLVHIARTAGYRKKTIVRLTVERAGLRCDLIFYNNPYIGSAFEIGERVAFYGLCQFSGNRCMLQVPVIERVGEKRKLGFIYPVYSLTQGLSNDELLNWIQNGMDESEPKDLECFPDVLRKQRGLCNFEFAIRQIHRPQNVHSLNVAKYRLIYEEFFVFQYALLSLHKSRNLEQARSLSKTTALQEWKKRLPYALTAAQERVLQEILEDCARKRPMQRLLQGDVGSGKTVIALAACLLAYDNGFQSVLLAPTEILAKQHYEEALKYFSNQKIRIAMLTGSTPMKEKERIYAETATGACDLLIATHAVLEEKIRFHSLAVAVTDEQHRFGVEQRNRLTAAYEYKPHVLVMSATPIPRTLALTLYSDLDQSVIDEFPKGRKSIITMGIPIKQRGTAYDRVREELRKGNQAYFVCPLIEENESLDLKAAETLFQELKKNVFPEYSIALIHGNMKPKEKNEWMRRFKEGDIQILVSTTVIEVGIHVEKATVMVIENAERFGLSQLHQLRGRVGRGTDQSYCILIYEAKTEFALRRIQAMEASQDGFVIAQKDLELRGPGEMFGLRQHGFASFRLADPAKHQSVLMEAREDVKKIISGHLLENKDLSMLEEAMYKRWQRMLTDVSLS